jgi:hypothetical protein
MVKTCSRRRRSMMQRHSASHAASSVDGGGNNNNNMSSGKAAKQHGRRHKASTETTPGGTSQAPQRTTQVRNQQEITQLPAKAMAKGKSKQRRSKQRKVQGRKRTESIQASCMYLVGSPDNANDATGVKENEVKRELRLVKYKLTPRAPVVQTQGARAHDVQAFQELIKSGKTTWGTTCHNKARVTPPEPEAEPAAGHAIDGGQSNLPRQQDVERKYEDEATSESASAASDDELELEAQLIGLRTRSFWRRETSRRATAAVPTNTPVDDTPTADASGVSNQARDDIKHDGPRSRVSIQHEGLGDDEEGEEKPWSPDADEWSACAMLDASTGIFTQMSLLATVESEADVAGLLDRVATEADGGSVSEWLQDSLASVIGWFSLGL